MLLMPYLTIATGIVAKSNLSTVDYLNLIFHLLQGMELRHFRKILPAINMVYALTIFLSAPFSKGGEFFMDDVVRERTPKLVFGGVFSFNNGISSATGTNGGRYIYGDSTQKILRPGLTKAGVDYMFKYRGFYSLGDYVITSATVPNNVYGEFSTSGDFKPFTGQTPEQIKNTVMSRINLGAGLNVQAGYMINKYALAARYSYLRQDEQSADFATVDKMYSLVVTRYFAGHNLKLNLETGYQQFNKEVTSEEHNGTIYLRTMLTVQF